ncbi:MAG: hypothetical protein AAGB19_20110 [Cyanobacteria bacterium P01_F01_bin.3]
MHTQQGLALQVFPHPFGKARQGGAIARLLGRVQQCKEHTIDR